MAENNKEHQDINPEHREIINEAVSLAQIHARDHGLQIGAFVIHPDHKWIYKLHSIDGDTAIVLRRPKTEGEEPQKLALPVNGLCDFDILNNIAVKIKAKKVVAKVATAIARASAHLNN